jgi:hypothetical protein
MESRLLACQVNNGGQSILEMLYLTRANLELPNASMHGVLSEFRLFKEGAALFPESHPQAPLSAQQLLHRATINTMVPDGAPGKMSQEKNGLAESNSAGRMESCQLPEVWPAELANSKFE